MSRWGLLVIVLAVGAGLLSTNATAASPTVGDDSALDRIIVVWADDARNAERREARREARVAFERDLGDRRFQLVEIKPGQSRGEAIRELRRDPAVAVAEPEQYLTELSIPNDPFFGLLWGLRNTGQAANGIPGALAGADINALSAWTRTIGSPSTVVAVIDSGYRAEHPDLAAGVWTNPDEIPDGVDNDGNGIIDDLNGADFVGSDLDAPSVDGDPTDDDLFTMPGGHGVHVAGTIGATRNNGLGVAGVAQVTMMPLRVCSVSQTTQDRSCPYSSILEAIHYAGQKGARVANMSLGGSGSDEAFAEAIATYPDTLFVAAAGNDGENNDVKPHYPCVIDPVEFGLSEVDNMICVAATDAADVRADFSHWGRETVDLGAPGVDVLSVAQLRWLIHETFEVNDFAQKWFASGEDGGFVRSDEPPLGSWGITDSPGGPPIPGTVKESTMHPVTIPAGYRGCRLAVTGQGGSNDGFIEVLLDDEVVLGVGTGPLSGHRELELMNHLESGGELSLRVRYSAPAEPEPTSGLWIDQIELLCVAKPGEAQGYRFSNGTSMAAPHVAGAAALLFSLRPDASVEQVRQALFRGVKPVTSLRNLTVTGGRLDAGASADLLDTTPPPAPTFSGTIPSSPAQNTNPRVRGQAQRGAMVQLFGSDDCSGVPVATGTAAEFATGFAIEVDAASTTKFTARATDVVPLESACSAPITYVESSGGGGGDPDGDDDPDGGGGDSDGGGAVGGDQPGGGGAVNPGGNDGPGSGPGLKPAKPSTRAPRCVVPRLRGKPLPKARAALGRAGCRVGRVRKPGRMALRKHRPARLVVKTSFPRPRARPANRRVNLVLQLKPKPKPKRAPAKRRRPA